MVSRLSSNHLLISALAKRQRSKNPLQAGFTLVELLIVVIIIGILAAVALPGFLNQAQKAKYSSAKALVSSLAKECSLSKVDASSFIPVKTVGNQQIKLGTGSSGAIAAATAEKTDWANTDCTPTTGNSVAFNATVITPSGVTPTDFATIQVLSDGSLVKGGGGAIGSSW
jgi:prepilin-type N-terminal cleavage/methylation domain-containing protein